jgi:hypothetical protein
MTGRLATYGYRIVRFCEQKAAKNFVNLGRAGFTAKGPD